MGISSQVDSKPIRTERWNTAYIACIALYVLVYVAPLDVRPLASPDEVRYGAIAHEMLVSGDWVSPRFNGVRYFEKPILGHWINALSLAAFGETAFALRLPVALATGLTAWLVFAFSRRFASAFCATLAGAAFLTTSLVAGTGTFAVLDPFLNLSVTAALVTWYLGMHEPSRGKRLGYLAICGCACGAAFLVKGFVGWAIPAIVAAGHLAAQRQWRSWVTLSWLPISTAIAVALPWAVLVHLREPDYWHYFFWVEHVQRFAGDNAQHTQPPWYYLAYLPVVTWPWILCWPAVLLGLRGTVRHSPFLSYTVLWALLPFVFFSLAKGKLLTYLLPCLPPLSILMAAGLERYLEHPRQRALRAATIAAGVLLALGLAALLAAQSGLLGSPPYDRSETVLLTALYTLLCIVIVAAMAASARADGVARLVAIAMAGVAFILPLQALLPRSVTEEALPMVAVARYAPAPDTVVVSDGSLFGTAAWTLKRNDIYVVSAGEIEYGLSYPEARHRKLTGTMLDELLAANRHRYDVLIICKPETERAIASHLPATASRWQEGSTVFVRIPKSE